MIHLIKEVILLFAFFANIFGYLLNFIYQLVNNYGIAIIIFCIVLKLIMLPLSIKQQRTMKKSAKLQDKMKQLQFKYKNDPEKLNQEVMKMYKEENMSPFSGCLSSIVQIIILLSVFYLVSSPLTYMKKVDSQEINSYKEKLGQEQNISKGNYPEIQIIQVYGKDNEQVKLNMEFLGLDLSKVLTQSLNDWKVYVIPALYVISSIISLKITNATQKKMQNKKKEENEQIIIENNEEKALKKDEEEVDPMEQANKSMSLFMPIMSLSIAIIAPLGLALYWLMNNILMIAERLVLNKVFDKEEEKENE